MEDQFSIDKTTENKGNKTWLVLGIIVIVLLSVLLIFNIFSTTGNSTGKVVGGNEKPVVKIGVITPLTGEMAFIGKGIPNAIKLAQERMDKNTKYDYRIIYEDNKNLDPKETLTAAEKLINVDNVDAIFTVSSGTGNIVSPLTEENKIVHIGYASDPNVAKGEYNFIHATTPASENRLMVKELENRGIKKIAIISMNQEGAVAIFNDFKEKIKSTDIQIVSDQKFNLGTKDFKTILMKAKESNPDIYLSNIFSPELEILTKQAKELGITEFTSIESFDFTTQPELFEGLWYVTQPIGNKEFTDIYQSEYKEIPPIAAANSYDMFNIIVNVYEKLGDGKTKPSHEAIAKEIENLKGYNGALGELTMLSNHIIDSNAIIREIKNGKPVQIG